MTVLADLPPVGDHIETRSWSALPSYKGYQAIWLDCGTAALALALLHARQHRPGILAPEVLVPAYACPDLVAAAAYAGVMPVLVDTGTDDAGYDLNALERSINHNTLAVIAVNFLGIRDQLAALKLKLPPGVALLEDNAQCYPEVGKATSLFGDYVIASFGRGKPASILGGGLVLVRDSLALDRSFLDEQVAQGDDDFSSLLKHLAKIHLYNLLRRPRFYFWINRNPLSAVGETRYKPLKHIEFMPSRHQSLVASNAHHHLASSPWREAYYDAMFSTPSAAQSLALKCMSRRGRLLRYPVLCETGRQRDKLLQALQTQGLGASAMYARPVIDVSGVKNRVAVYQPVDNAREFADRLLTLPLHSGVTSQHLRRIGEVSHSILGSGQPPCGEGLEAST